VRAALAPERDDRGNPEGDDRTVHS
jgi:hypothetical protein